MKKAAPNAVLRLSCAQETVETGIAQKASRRIRDAAWDPSCEYRLFDLPYRQGRKFSGRSVCRKRFVVRHQPAIVGNLEIRQIECDALDSHRGFSRPHTDVDHDARLQFVEKPLGIGGDLFQRHWQKPSDDRHLRDDAAIKRIRYVSRRIVTTTRVWRKPSYQRRTPSHDPPRLMLGARSKLRVSCAQRQCARRAENCILSSLDFAEQPNAEYGR